MRYRFCFALESRLQRKTENEIEIERDNLSLIFTTYSAENALCDRSLELLQYFITLINAAFNSH